MKRQRHGKRHLCAALPVMLLFICMAAGCSAKPAETPLISRSGFFFDTFIQISIYDKTDGALLDDCMALAEHYENLFSATKEGSDIWNINHADGEAVTVDEETVKLLETALSWGEKTGGVLDVTIGAVSALWNFSREPKGPLPDQALIEEALSHVDCRGIVIHDHTVRLTDPGARLDTGAIAKGFIADRIKERLLENGVGSALINLGGNVLAIGAKGGDAPFAVGVQMPFDTRADTAAVVPAADCSVVTSGNYERFFEEDGRLYHHILDPADGYPADSGVLSVTVVSASSADADALSTALFIMGARDGLAFIEKTDGAEALFITGTPRDVTHCQIITSSGFPGK